MATLLEGAGSRRVFLGRITTVCAAAIAASTGAAWASPDDAASLKAKTASQWARINRGLDAKTMAAYRTIAGHLAPRAPALLGRPDGEAQLIKAIADELKKAGVYPDRRPNLDSKCSREEADRLRSEAASASSTGNAAGTNIAVAGDLATVPYIGTVIAAVLMAVAAVIILIGQMRAKAQEDQAQQKDTAARLAKLRDSMVLKLERARDCDCFGKKAS